MTKCDFCIYSSPNEKCFWTIPAHRQDSCKQAIEKMAEALKNIITVKVEKK